MKKLKIKKNSWLYITILVAAFLLSVIQQLPDQRGRVPAADIDLNSVPDYMDQPYVTLNGNVPQFEETDLDADPYEEYSLLDSLGRCGTAIACISPALMPTEERGNISEVKPSGWMSVQYDFVDGNSLYNRCHLIGFQLTGENANERNLITGTRYMNVEGMLPFENMVADYIKETGNQVLYRVTPVFIEDELVARGVQMEAYSIDDNGEGICFNVYCYNVQPGVRINYATGESEAEEFSCAHEPAELVLNVSSGKFHLPTCSGAAGMNQQNRRDYTCCPEELIAKGYEPCGSCNP